MADSPAQLAVIKDQENVLERLDLIFNDANEQFQIVQPPTIEHARQILAFARRHRNTPNLVIQCLIGIGRSMAVLAALTKIAGQDNRHILSAGTYNRKLYRLLLSVAGVAQDVEPLVSIAVRVKYAPDRLLMFLLSMRRQRYDNWELIAVTDGPNPLAVEQVKSINDPRIRVIETTEPRGRWGHPYRQIGLDACRGEFIGMSNDDNYYVPGYLEQMIFAMKDADLAYCSCLHSYLSWDVSQMSGDLGSWIARSSLVREIPWTGVELASDRRYFDALHKRAGNRVVEVKRPLFVHN
ncbi:MAG: glycosyltransferase [Tepidisphaeraceae bacterium]